MKFVRDVGLTHDVEARMLGSSFDIKVLNTTLDDLVKLFGILGILFAFFSHIRNKSIAQLGENWRNRQEEIGTYNNLNERYGDFLDSLLLNPDINIGEFSDPLPAESKIEQYRRYLIYAKLVTLFERAFLMFKAIEFEEDRRLKDHDNVLVRTAQRLERAIFGDVREYKAHFHRSQYRGWDDYITYYCGLAEFQKYWRDQYANKRQDLNWQDTDFENFIWAKMDRQDEAGPP